MRANPEMLNVVTTASKPGYPYPEAGKTSHMSDAPLIGGDELRFGPFRLSRHRRSLMSDTGPVQLGARAFDLLSVLLDAPGQLLSKQDLLDQVWPGMTVEENNLHVQIVALRRALGPQHALIQTVPGRGYRFAGEIEHATVMPPPVPLPPAQAGPEHIDPPKTQASSHRLIGREAELAALQTCLECNRLVTITGPGGIGKTRLALALGQMVAPKFPGGVTLIDLAPLTDAGLVESAAAAALGLRLTDDTALADRICAAMGSQPALLLFDNCEHLLDGVAALVAALLQKCETLCVVATSQEPLRIAAETCYRLDPLALPPPDATQPADLAQFGAVRLFVGRAEAADRRFRFTADNAPAVAEICRRLDGIPLALEMAAARLPSLGLEELRRRLGERLRMLTLGARNAATRHRTLRGTITWSYELLAPEDRAVFRRLGVFAGGFSAPEAVAVLSGADNDEWNLLDALGRLIDKSLVTVEPGELPRYRLLESLKLFAIEQMAAHQDHAAFQRRHAAYFETLFARAYDEWEDTDDAIWLARYGVELDNVRAALDWAFEAPGAADIAISLAASAAWLWDKVAPLAEGRRILARAEAMLTPQTPPAVAARLHRMIGVLWHISDRPRALAALLQAEALYRAIEDAANLGAVLALIGFVRTALGASSQAYQSLTEARDLLAPTGRRKSLFNVMNHLGVLAAIDGDMKSAREMFVQALNITQRSGNRDDEMVVLVNLAEVEFNLGETGAAVERTSTAIALLRGTGRLTDLGWALTNLATYLLISERPADARRAAVEALALVQPAGGFILRICLLQWALLAAESGSLAYAARLAGFVAAGYRQAGETFQPTEKRLYDNLQAKLDAGLTPAEQAFYTAEGEVWPETFAARIAAQLAAMC